jgi:hypothetical protein
MGALIHIDFTTGWPFMPNILPRAIATRVKINIYSSTVFEVKANYDQLIYQYTHILPQVWTQSV